MKQFKKIREPTKFETNEGFCHKIQWFQSN